MAADILYTPVAEARWVHLITPRPQLDASKPPAWSCDLLLRQDNPEHAEFLARLEAVYVDLHGSKKRRSDKGTPWKPDKADPTIMVVKFKTQQFTRRDGTEAPGPRIIDASRQPWDGAAIGNGSQLRLSFVVYPWERAEGTGISLQPRAAQVVEFIPYEQADATEGFGEVEGGFTVGGASGYVDEFSDEGMPF